MSRHSTVAAPQCQAATLVGASATILAACVLLDSGMEHYRGAFRNRAIVTPLITAIFRIVINAGPTLGSERLRSRAHLATAVSGAAGLGFHFFDLLRRPGRLNWSNLFYATPVGAPAAFVLAGCSARRPTRCVPASARFGSIAIDSGRALAGHAEDGSRSSDRRRRRRLPELGHPEPLGLRRIGVFNGRRCQSVGHDTGDRLPNS